MTVRVALAGAGAFGAKHADAIATIEDVVVAAIVDPDESRAAALAETHGVGRTLRSLDDALADPTIDAVILTTPTPFHARQAIQVLEAGKHVQVEIPLCDAVDEGRAVVAAQQSTGLVAMCGHTRRFNPSHQWLHARIGAGEFTLQHLDVQTFFFRRTNTNALGQPRTWTDHLLWHHAAHTVDLFLHQTGDRVVAAHALEGPTHPDLGIAMDMSIHLKSERGALCSLSLSFNNDGPLGTFFRYIGDTGTYIARYDELIDGHDRPVDLTGVADSPNGIELQDREFFAAIRENRQPSASVGDVLPTYEILHDLEIQLKAGRR